jgi:hypothetical protein
MLRSWTPALIVWLAFHSGALAEVKPPQARLSYEAPTSPETCPDELWFHQAVAARLGRDPFSPDAALNVVARINRDNQTILGSLEFNYNDNHLGKRSFRSAQGDCQEVASAMVAAVSVALDPQGPLAQASAAAAPKSDEKPAPAANRTPVVPSTETTGNVEAVKEAVHRELDASLGVFGSAGLSPEPTAGALLHLEGRSGNFGVAGELVLDLPSSISVPPGRVGSRTLLGSLLPCTYLGQFNLCVQVSAGAILVTGQIVQPTREVSSFLLLTGARVGYSWSLGSVLSLQPFGSVQAIVTRTTIYSGTQVVWVTAPVEGQLGVMVQARLW